ncbi:hypothetical protein [uncultured Neptuniibacter sp.]|uniref:hypothetical protein n=1 Tax=uncultured Neptuniibacter sp. TaxID=502143 RepID=UPI002636D930|nr:hypothetical protein [uncultured Neptuniibacter sp.]
MRINIQHTHLSKVATLLSGLLLSVGAQAIEAKRYVDNGVQISLQSSNDVIVRSTHLERSTHGWELNGRLTRDWLSRGLDQGYIEAVVINKQGEVIQTQQLALDLQTDDQFERFSGFCFRLNRSPDQIGEILVTHVE